MPAYAPKASEPTKTPKAPQGRLFAHPLLEALTRSSPGIILGIYIPYILAMLVACVAWFGLGAGATAGLFVAGLVFWTMAEYVLHRYIFHWVDESKPALQRFHYIVHGFHHTYPRDKDHLFMPPLPSLVLSGAFFGLFYLVLGKWALPFHPGFMAGYLAYASMHYSMHTVPNPPKLLRPLWRHHQLHHHKTPEAAYGVSSPLWDYVFGTMPNLAAPQQRPVGRGVQATPALADAIARSAAGQPARPAQPASAPSPLPSAAPVQAPAEYINQ